MEVRFICPRWGSEDVPWPVFIKKVKDAGYDGIETSLPTEGAAEIADMIREMGLFFIIQHYEFSLLDTPAEQYEAYENYLWKAVSYKPLFINSQTGKDYFTYSDNLPLFDIADKVQQYSGTKILHETHRGKWSFAAHICKEYLMQLPNLRLTLDISHWCNTAETFLENQSEAVDMAISRTDYVHARVGHTQSAQVPDPRAAMWQYALEKHLYWWDKVIASHKHEDFLCICPEFGPPPYAHLHPYTQEPVANQWEINLNMKNLLQKRYA
jgi:sugar phosphate isomerase/epimerase